jgi:hypothetical protein
VENVFIFPGTSFEEIDDFIENDLDIREGNERKYLYPQYLYELLLEKTNVNIQFIKTNKMGINECNYEWTRPFHTLFLEIVTELGPDWEYKCMKNISI